MFIYAMKLEDTDFYKIGYAADVNKRMKNIQTGQPFNVQLIISFRHVNVKDAELVMHTLLTRYHVRGEWFSVRNRTVITTPLLWLRENQEYDNPRKLYISLTKAVPRADYIIGDKMPHTKDIDRYIRLNIRRGRTIPEPRVTKRGSANRS